MEHSPGRRRSSESFSIHSSMSDSRASCRTPTNTAIQCRTIPPVSSLFTNGVHSTSNSRSSSPELVIVASTRLRRSRSSSDVTVIGFSKGCVVLNQCLHELTAARQSGDEHDLGAFLSRIRTFIWLDGGHNNGDRAMIWPTDESLVFTLEHFRIRTETYVTPFQIDSSNPHKKHHREHYETFVKLSDRCSARHATLFATEPPSIDKHFELLSVFGINVNQLPYIRISDAQNIPTSNDGSVSQRERINQ